MREILFSKYSMERSPQFAIRTSIVRDGERKWVEKVPMTRDAAAHVERLASSYDALRHIYESTRVHPCPVTVENGVAKFEFLEGEFFHEKLSRLIEEKDKEGILALCKKFVAIVKSGAGIDRFQKTPEFVCVFGDVEVPDGLTAMPFSNVDWIFENLVEEKNGNIALIDYEWCFDFPVPLEYVLYRGLYVSFERLGFQAFFNQTICPLLGISAELIPVLRELEKQFYCYVEKGKHSEATWYRYTPILQRSYDWQGEIERNHQKRDVNTLPATMYWDTGKGYSEVERTQIKPYKKTSDGTAYFHVGDVPRGCRHARFDPTLDRLCTVSDMHVMTNIKSCPFIPLNGTTVNSVITFSNMNPQIEIDLPEGVQWIKISANIRTFSDSDYGEVLSAVQDIPVLQRELQTERERSSRVQQALEDLNQTHHELLEQIRRDAERVQQEKELLLAQITEKGGYIAQLDGEMAVLNSKIVCLTEENTAALEKSEDLENQLQQMTAYARHVEEIYHQLAEQYNTMAGSRSWRITAPVRHILDRIKSWKAVGLISKGLLVLRTQGFRAAGRKMLHYFSGKQSQPAMVMPDSIESFSALADRLGSSPDCTVYLPEVLAGFDEHTGEKVLLVSHELDLTGAPIALFYFAQVLKEEGYCPFIVSPKAGNLIGTIVEEQIPVIVCPALYAGGMVSSFARLLDLVVANTIVTAPVLQDIDGAVPALWWIHEAEVSYTQEFESRMPQILPSTVTVCTGGEYARQILLKHRPNYTAEELLYYIPDRSREIEGSDHNFALPEASKGKTIFCCIGAMEQRKGQDIAVEAIERLPLEDLLSGYFVFVGRQYYPESYERIERLCRAYPDNAFYISELPMRELGMLERQMDCLICPSRDDPMPVVVTEAIQLSKLVICSENTGSARLLEKGQGGLIYGDNDPQKLSGSISYVLHHNDEMDEMRMRARMVYEQCFSKIVFQENVLSKVKMLINTTGARSEGKYPHTRAARRPLERLEPLTGSVSVIIPTYNGGAQFGKLLQSLREQRGVQHIEVIVVDSGSTDETQELCQKYNAVFERVPHEDFTHSYARNKGAQAARGDILLFMTQDALPQDEGWVKEMIQPLLAGEAAAVSCREQCPEGTDPYYAAASWNHARFLGISDEDRLNVAEASDTPEQMRAKGSLNDVSTAIRADCFKRNLYRFNYGEDLDMGLRLLAEGYPIKLLASTTVIHGHDRPAGYYLKRGLVESVALGQMCAKWKAPTESDEAVARKIMCGNLLLREAVSRARAQYSAPSALTDFFATLIRDLQGMGRCRGEEIMSVGKGSVDPILNRCLADMEPWTAATFEGEQELIFHITYYLENLLREYMKYRGITTIDLPMQESVYSCMEKQFCMAAGNLLGRLGEDSEMARKLQWLREGV